MAVKPTLDPKWSTSNNPLDNIEPTESLKIGGVPAGGVWGREFLNWQFYAISQWVDWVRSSALDKDNNLSDLTNANTARTNLGLNNASVTLGANIATADKLKTSRKISLSGDLTGDVMFDGSTDVTLSAQVGNDSHTHSASTITAATTSVAGVTQLNNTVTSSSTTQAATANAARLAYNRAAEYAPSKTGTGASGTWGINISGNALTATNASLVGGHAASTFAKVANFVSSKGTNGWQRLEGGLIIQWGTRANGGTGYYPVTFPIAFPSACVNLQTSYNRSWDADGYRAAHSITKTGAQVGTDGASTFWLAIGY